MAKRATSEEADKDRFTVYLPRTTRLALLKRALDESAEDVIVVVVEGEHDIYTAPTLRERLEEALGRGGGIVVDLTAATFVESFKSLTTSISVFLKCSALKP